MFKRTFTIVSHSRLNTAVKARKRAKLFIYCISREDSDTNGKFLANVFDIQKG